MRIRVGVQGRLEAEGQERSKGVLRWREEGYGGGMFAGSIWSQGRSARVRCISEMGEKGEGREGRERLTL